MGKTWVEPKVNFSIENRPATIEQKEAGRRLFSNLIKRARSSQNEANKAKEGAAGGGGAPPALP
jgi:hypothetical protein